MANIRRLSHFTPKIFVLGILFRFSFGELRFCLNGPQRMLDSDCPGGFVFKEAQSPSCKFYAKDGNHTGIVLSAPTNPCDDTTARAIENEGDDLNDLGSFGYFTWEEFEEGNDTLGVFDPEDVCHKECLSEWEDHNTATDEEPIPEEFDESSVSDEDKKFCVTTNRRMFIRMLMDDADEEIKLPPPPPLPGMPAANISEDGTIEIDPNQNLNMTAPVSILNQTLPDTNATKPPPSMGPAKIEGETGITLVSTVPYDSGQLNIIKLLAKSMKVVISACGPYVNEDFYEQVLKGMIFISKLIEDKLLDLGSDMYKKISAILDHCIGKKIQEFSLNGTKCDGLEKVEGIFFLKSKEYWPYRLTGRSFRWGKYHPIIDATWTTLDIVQCLCFDSFSSDMMMGHVFHMAMEGLFPAKIRLMWRINPEMKNDKFWNNIMQTHDLNVTMKNLDACAVGARNTSIFGTPLPRPFLTMEEAMKEAPEAPPHEPPKGWNKTIEKYWDYYERQGGFKKLSDDFGKCFQEHDHIEEQEDMIEDLKKSC